MIIETDSIEDTKRFGQEIGLSLRGGEVIELVGDVGAGKTTFTKGLALGLGIDEPVQSPSFTISQSYSARNGLRLVHYDFYRLAEPGIMSEELRESTEDPSVITVVEWADTVADVLPTDRKRIVFSTTSEEGRRLEVI